jgi:hypothetical protein
MIDIMNRNFVDRYDPLWREKELSLRELIEKFPEFPALIILKTDLQHRSVR